MDDLGHPYIPSRDPPRKGKDCTEVMDAGKTLGGMIMKRKNKKKTSRAEKKTAQFRKRARNEIEIRILVSLSDVRFDCETKMTSRRRYWSVIIHRHGAALGILINKNGEVELRAADRIHGMARVTLVRQEESAKDPGRTLEILKKDITFFLMTFCNGSWYDLMAHLEECRDHGMEDWKRGCGLYQEYLQLRSKAYPRDDKG